MVIFFKLGIKKNITTTPFFSRLSMAFVYESPERSEDWSVDKKAAFVNRKKSRVNYGYRFTERQIMGQWFPFEKCIAYRIFMMEKPWRKPLKSVSWGFLSTEITTRCGYQLAYLYKKFSTSDEFEHFCEQVDTGVRVPDAIRRMKELSEDAEQQLLYNDMFKTAIAFDASVIEDAIDDGFPSASSSILRDDIDVLDDGIDDDDDDVYDIDVLDDGIDDDDDDDDAIDALDDGIDDDDDTMGKGEGRFVIHIPESVVCAHCLKPFSGESDINVIDKTLRVCGMCYTSMVLACDE